MKPSARTPSQYDRYGSTTATAHDFITLTSQLAGRDLTPTFDDWLNDTDLPDLILH